MRAPVRPGDGIRLHRAGRLPEAIEAYRGELAALGRGAGDAGARSLLAANLAAACLDAGQPEEARREAQAACALARAASHPAAEAMSWRVLGRAAARTGDPRGAVDSFSRAAACLQEAGESRGLVSTLLGLAQLCAAMGDRAAARSHVERAAKGAADDREKGRVEAVRRALEGSASRSAGAPDRTQPVPVEPTPLDHPQVARLLEINKALNRERDPARLFARILDAAVELAGAERGFLVVRGEKGVRVAAARHLSREDVQDAVGRVSRSVVDACLREGRAVVTVDAMDDVRFSAAQSVQRLRLRSLLAVPLRLGPQGQGASGAQGVLCVDNPLQRSAFGPRAVQLLSALAEQAGIAWSNADLLERNRRQLEEIEGLNGRLAARVADQRDALRRAQERLVETARPGEWGRRYGNLVGSGQAMRSLCEQIDRAAPLEAPVLLAGESGTGKELAARALHAASGRRDGPWVALSCAAIAPDLVEAELFGHVRGAFTGAVRDRTGLFGAADGGTLFLDEVGELPAPAQAAVLRAVESGEVRPVGGTESRKTNVRIVSATSRDLEAEAAAGRFRKELLYRLNAVTIRVPPLRERAGDIPELVSHFVERAAREGGREPPTVAPEVLDALSARPWPGNVRELQSEVRRLVLRAEGDRITSETLRAVAHAASPGPAVGAGESAGDDGSGGGLGDEIGALEARRIREALAAAGGNRTHAAARLGISRNALLRKMAKHGIH